MNLILSKMRASLDPETLDILLNIRYFPEDIKTWDVNRLVFKYLFEHNYKSCKYRSGPKPQEDGIEIDISESAALSYDDEYFETESLFGDESLDTIDGNESLDMSENCENSPDKVDDVEDMDIDIPDEDEPDEEVPMETIPFLPPDHNYAQDNNVQKLITMEEEVELFEVLNYWLGKSMTVDHDDSVVVKRGIAGESNRSWFQYESFIVSSNGKVLQCNGAGEPVTMEYMNRAEPKQKWAIKRVDAQFNNEIVCLHDSLTLDLLNAELTSVEAKVGTLLPGKKSYHLWKINKLD